MFFKQYDKILLTCISGHLRKSINVKRLKKPIEAQSTKAKNGMRLTEARASQVCANMRIQEDPGGRVPQAHPLNLFPNFSSLQISNKL